MCTDRTSKKQTNKKKKRGNVIPIAEVMIMTVGGRERRTADGIRNWNRMAWEAREMLLTQAENRKQTYGKAAPRGAGENNERKETKKEKKLKTYKKCKASRREISKKRTLVNETSQKET